MQRRRPWSVAHRINATPDHPVKGGRFCGVEFDALCRGAYYAPVGTWGSHLLRSMTRDAEDRVQYNILMFGAKSVLIIPQEASRLHLDMAIRSQLPSQHKRVRHGGRPRILCL